MIQVVPVAAKGCDLKRSLVGNDQGHSEVNPYRNRPREKARHIGWAGRGRDIEIHRRHTQGQIPDAAARKKSFVPGLLQLATYLLGPLTNFFDRSRRSLFTNGRHPRLIRNRSGQTQDLSRKTSPKWPSCCVYPAPADLQDTCSLCRIQGAVPVRPGRYDSLKGSSCGL